MSAKLFQRATVVFLVLATITGAVGLHLVFKHDLDVRRHDRVDEARHRISDSLRRRAYFLEDVADMVGVHDDADATEFSRYAHVRGRNELSVVAVQWLRRSPTGKLQPPAETGANPMLIPPAGGADAGLANAARSATAAPAIRVASIERKVAISSPVRLADGNAAFYLAIPVEARRFSGEVSRVESRSVIVGLIDAQALVSERNGDGKLAALRLRDQVTPLASIGSGLHNAVRDIVPAGDRRWTVSVDGGSLSPLEQGMPWLILGLGLGLALAVATSLQTSARRRDSALRRLEVAHAQAERLSRHDPVTDIFNRRHFSEALAAELKLPGPPPAVLMLDLDHFKRVNDEYGHLAGDAVLRAAAQRIASITRASDCLARWGGEEFAILAPVTDREGAGHLAERARAALASAPIEVDGISLELTLSVGVAVGGDELHTADELVNAADRALYEAKDAGRNCVRFHDLRAVVSS